MAWSQNFRVKPGLKQTTFLGLGDREMYCFYALKRIENQVFYF